MAEEEKEPQVRVVDRRWWARGESAPAEEEKTARKPTYVEDLELRLADAGNQLQTYMVEHRRSLEEFEQVRARLRRDTAREVERGRRGVLAELLEVVDNLDRAVAAADDAQASGARADDTLLRGVRLVRDQFLAKLESFGVARVPSLGTPFDAARHEAVTTAPVDDPSKEGVVIAVIKEAYAIGDELLRPASVVVGARGQD